MAPWIQRVVFGLRTLFNRGAVEREIDDELRFHLDMEAASRERGGSNADAARTDAARLFGGVERTKDDLRDARGGNGFENTVKDVRYAVRALRRNPGFTSVAILTLALGIGANTALFSVVNGVLLRPLPYSESDRLVSIRNVWGENRDPLAARRSISPAEYFDYRDRLTAFEAFGVYALASVSLTGDGEPERLSAAAMTASIFPTLRVTPALGRVFAESEDVPGVNVAMLGHGLWQRRFAGSRDVIGRSILINGEATTVVGVMPEGFRLPEQLSETSPAELFVPLGMSRDSVTIRGSHFLSGIARLKRGLTPAQGSADVAAVARRFPVEYPSDYPAKMNFEAGALPLLDSVVGQVRPTLVVLLGAVGFVLLIACANVASLLLSRTESRRREMAVRTALGAARGRLLRQLLVESVVLSLTGGVVGVALASVGTRLLVALRPPNIPRLDDVGVDLRVLLFALAASSIVGVLFGLLPAIHATRLDVQTMLREGGRGNSAGGRQGARRALVIAEVAIALVLLVGAGLITRSFVQLMSVDPGYRVDHVLTVPIDLPGARYPDANRVITFYRELGRRVGALPGVTAAGGVAGVPLVASRGDLSIDIEGRPVAPGEQKRRADWQVVTPGYFKAIGMRLVRGRAIEETDLENAPGVVVINETLAKKYWPNDDPIGKRFKLGGGAGPGMVSIIGVVADVRQSSLSATPDPEMYLAHTQFRFWGGGRILSSLYLVLRTSGDPSAMSRVVRGEISALDRQLPVGEFRTMEDVRGESVSQPRFLMFLFSTFSVVALAIAVIGIYGVIAYGVAQRRKEIGIRVALGARPSSVAGMIVKQGIGLAVAGIVVGLALAFALTRFLAGFLFAVTPTDPITLVTVVLSLGAAALLASFIPARRATRTDPVEVLRAD
ncbi:MAG TPA: ABC transporter permease [Gemmatimonadaceae bacterium]|nr:ABC transporter permease [Gemmatimonadaceae bacterium]